MRNKPDYSSSPTSQQTANIFRITGWISFWLQLVLGVVSAGVLLLFGFFNAFFNRNPNPNQNNPATGSGIFLAICGLVALGVSIYLAFRYTRIARDMQSTNPNNRPRKSQTIQVLRLGLLINLAGMLVTLIGAQATVGTLVLKAISQPQGAVILERGQQLISGLDMLAVQANTNTVLAHFAGIICSLWLLQQVTRQ